MINELIKTGDYGKVSEKLGRSVKSIDNAMQRARKKIVNYLWQ